MKIVLRAASLGSILILMASACSKRDQYQRGSVPANPDPLKTSLTSDVVLPGAGLNPDVERPTPDSGASPSALTPAEIVAKVSEWNAQPVVWNESAGNIKIGETDWNSWYEQFLAFRRDGRVNFGFYNFDVYEGIPFCNDEQKQGASVCTTTSGVYILQNYDGPLAFPKADKSLVPVLMNSSLRDSVYTAADIEGAIVNGAPLNIKKRGEDFFRRFFQTFVAPYYTSSDVDCFREGLCSYVKDDQSKYYLWRYSAPGGMEGGLMLSTDQDRLLTAYFNRSSTMPIPKSMNSTGSVVNLLDGTIELPDVNGGVKFQLGDTAANFTKLALPPVNWAANAAYAFQQYSGFSVSFSKSKLERLADPTYSQAEAGDPSKYFGFDQNYASEIRIGEFPLVLLNPEREAYTKAQHLEELEILRLAIEKTVLADSQNQLYISRIIGDGRESTQFGTYGLNIVYKYKGRVYEFTYQTMMKSATAAVGLELLDDYEVNLLSPVQANGRVVAFGPFELQKPVQLEDLDLDLTNQATVAIGGTKRRVNITKYVKSRVGHVHNNLPDLMTYDEVLRFAVGNITVDAVDCRKIPKNEFQGYCVLTMYSSQFSWPEKVASFNEKLRKLYSADSETEALRGDRRQEGYLSAEVPTCSEDSVIRIGQTKKAAEMTLKSKGCTVLSLSSESAQTDKTVLFMSDTFSALHAGGENNRFVEVFQFY
jgi:hypothetical protein